MYLPCFSRVYFLRKNAALLTCVFAAVFLHPPFFAHASLFARPLMLAAASPQGPEQQRAAGMSFKARVMP